MKVTLYIADNCINDFMRAADLRPDYKWYVRIVNAEVTPTPGKKPDFMGLIAKSKASKGPFWVPAIDDGNKLHIDPDVRELSDGEKIFLRILPKT